MTNECLASSFWGSRSHELDCLGARSPSRVSLSYFLPCHLSLGLLCIGGAADFLLWLLGWWLCSSGYLQQSVQEVGTGHSASVCAKFWACAFTSGFAGQVGGVSASSLNAEKRNF